MGFYWSQKHDVNICKTHSSRDISCIKNIQSQHMYDRRLKCNDCDISDWTQLGKTRQRYTTIKSNENNPNCYDLNYVIVV